MSMRLFALSLIIAAASLACEPDDLSRQEDEPDAAVPQRDAAARDAREPDAAEIIEEDAAIVEADATVYPDARVRPDAGDAGVPLAEEPVYVCSQEALYSFDPATLNTTLIGSFAPFPGEEMVDIAIDLQGRLFGGSASGGIYLIDPLTARVTEVVRLQLQPTGLTFLSDGRLVLAGSRVVIINVMTGDEASVITASAPQTSGDIIGLADGSLYSTVLTGGGGDDLIRINPMGGAYERVGSLRENGVFGLGWANDTLYGFTNTGAVLAIDPATANVLSRVDRGEPWYGATTNPVLW